MPVAPKAKIRFYRSTYKLYSAINRAGLRVSRWALDRNLDNLEARVDHLDKVMGIDTRDQFFDESPINWSLTPAGEALMARSLKQEAELFVADANGNTDIHKLTR